MTARNVSMTVEDALWFDMFDNVEYSFLKNILSHDKEDTFIDVTISVEEATEQTPEELRNINITNVMIVTFQFDLDFCLTRPFIHKSRFTWTSPYGYKLNDILQDNDNDEEEEEEQPSVCEECEKPTVNIDDKLCHCCYHKTCNEGECYCAE